MASIPKIQLMYATSIGKLENKLTHTLMVMCFELQYGMIFF